MSAPPGSGPAPVTTTYEPPQPREDETRQNLLRRRKAAAAEAREVSRAKAVLHLEEDAPSG